MILKYLEFINESKDAFGFDLEDLKNYLSDLNVDVLNSRIGVADYERKYQGAPPNIKTSNILPDKSYYISYELCIKYARDEHSRMELTKQIKEYINLESIKDTYRVFLDNTNTLKIISKNKTLITQKDWFNLFTGWVEENGKMLVIDKGEYLVRYLKYTEKIILDILSNGYSEENLFEYTRMDFESMFNQLDSENQKALDKENKDLIDELIELYTDYCVNISDDEATEEIEKQFLSILEDKLDLKFIRREQVSTKDGDEVLYYYEYDPFWMQELIKFDYDIDIGNDISDIFHDYIQNIEDDPRYELYLDKIQFTTYFDKQQSLEFNEEAKRIISSN